VKVIGCRPAANHGAEPARRRGTSRPQQVRPDVQQLIDAMTDVPVFVQNGRLDAVATNRLGAALFSEMFVMPATDECGAIRVPR